jgi:hypothetical protein
VKKRRLIPKIVALLVALNSLGPIGWEKCEKEDIKFCAAGVDVLLG